MDVQVLDPVRTTAGLVDTLAAWKIALLAAPALVVKLFKTNVMITQITLLSALSEADYAGYVPVTISSLDGVFVDGAGTAWLNTPVALFVCAGGGTTNTIYSAGLCESTGAAATATATQAGGVVDAITVTSGGSGYQAPPSVVVTDATIGTGARAHAVLTAGVVTSIVIDAGGSGYTGPIITIEPPVRLLAGRMLANPLPMALATDAIPVVMELLQAN